MSDDLFHPMAPAHSVPTIIRRYHYQHLPPPSDPTDFMSSLRRGLRGVNEVGLWGKLKGAGWRFLLKLDNHNVLSEPPLRPDFPVAPPGTPRIFTPLPDVCITPATSPSFELSPPLPQEEGFLAVPVRTARGRSTAVSPPRKLPTPPGVSPLYSVLEAERRRRTNVASHPYANEPSLATPDLTTDDIIMALLYADSVFDEEDPDHDDSVAPQQWSSSDIVSVTTSSDSSSEPQDSPFTMSDNLVEEIRDTATDTDFLDELGLSAEDYRQLLEVVDFVRFDDKEEGLD